MNGSASLFLVKPLIVMAAKALGPGPTRLKLIKLVHNLSTPSYVQADDLSYEDEQAETTRRAA